MNRQRTVLPLVLFLLLVLCLAPGRLHAELTLESVYPSLGEMGQPLDAVLTGLDFDANTRVSMYLDLYNKKAILGSVDTPGTAFDVQVVGNLAYVADFDDGVQVIDIENPANPRIVGAVATPARAEALFVEGDYVYAACHDAGLQVIDASDPGDLRIVGSLALPGYLDAVTVAGGKAYIGSQLSGLHVVDIGNPADPQLLGSLEIPGYAFGVAVAGDKAYLGVQHEVFEGLRVIDVADPASLQVTGSVAVPDQIWGLTLSGDRVYAAAFVHGLQIIDVSDPTDPQVIGSADTTGRAIGVAVSADRAYVADGANGLQIVDVADPGNPQVIGTVDTPYHAHGVDVVGDIAYVADESSGLQVIDVKNPTNAQVIGNAYTPTSTRDVAVAGSYAYALDTNAGLFVIDVSDPAHPQITGSVDPPTLSINWFAVSGGHVYVATGTGGLQIIDVGDPTDPQIVGSVQTPYNAISVAVEGNLAYVADDSSVQVVDVGTPSAPQILGSVAPPGRSVSIAATGNRAFVGTFTGELHVLDVSDPSSPEILGSVDMAEPVRDVTAVGDTVYVANDTSGLQVIDVGTPRSPAIIGNVDTKKAWGVSVAGHYAYVADGENGLVVVDVHAPAAPRVLGSLDMLGNTYNVAIAGDMAFSANWSEGMAISLVPVEVAPVVLDDPAHLSVTIPTPRIPGHYTLRVATDTAAAEILGAVTFSGTVEYEIQRQKKGIVVAGGGPFAGNHLWDAIQTSTHFAYLSLLSQGYTRENVYFLSPNTGVDVDGDGLFNDIDIDATTTNIAYALTTWAADANEVILYMTDHGGSETFLLDGTAMPQEWITAEMLDGWLDTLQDSMPGRVVVIYDACHSGSFVPVLTPPEGKERTVITSSLAEEPAWFLNNGVLSFSYQFWASVFLNANLYDSYVTGSTMMAGNQTCMIDSNGNGIANEKEDRTLVADFIIGRGRVAASLPPVIGSVSGEQTLYGQTTATLQAENIFSLNSIQRVWAVIVPPDQEQASSDIPVTDMDEIELTDPDQDGIYEGEYQGFTLEGTYAITVFAKDSEGLLSLPHQTTVVQTAGESVGSTVTGSVLTDFGGWQGLTVTNATVTLQGTDFTTSTDESGNFILQNVPSGTYTLVVTAPDLAPIGQTIVVLEEQNLSLSLQKMSFVHGDANGDGVVGLEDVIRGLQVLSGIRGE